MQRSQISKKWILPSILTFWLMILPWKGSASTLSNSIGIYFDESGTKTCVDNVSSYPIAMPAYLILKYVSCSGGIGGWEAYVDSDPSLSVSFVSLRGNTISFGEFPNLIVGQCTPLPADSLVVLAEFMVIAQGPGGIYLKPSISPMIDGAQSPIFVFGDNPDLFALTNYAYGDSCTACSTIGDIECPVENTYPLGRINSESDISDQVISIIQTNQVHLPDRDGPFSYHELAFSSPELQAFLQSRESLTVDRVIPRRINQTQFTRTGDQVQLLGGAVALLLDVDGSGEDSRFRQQLSTIAGVISVEPNALTDDLCVNDPGFDQQWGLHAGAGIDAEAAWSHSTGSHNITICIVDKGARDGHEEFIGKRSGDIAYEGDHGARVAGIAAATADNGVGICGVSWGARVNFQKKDSTIAGTASAIAEGLTFKPHIMNHSYRLLSAGGANIYSPIIHKLFLDAYKLGVVHSVAAGNHYMENDPYVWPARNGWAWEGFDQGMMVVGAIDRDGMLANFSSSGPHTDFVAPGVDIISTTNDAILGGVADGTSFSAPHVAGASALILSLAPNLDPNDVEEILRLSCVDILGPGYDDRSGWGSIDVDNALDLISSNDLDHYSFSVGGVETVSSETYLNAVLEGYPGIDPEPRSVEVIKVRKDVVFPSSYCSPPHVWGRGNGSTGQGCPPWYNVGYTNVVDGTVTETGCTVESYVYRWPSNQGPPSPPFVYIPSGYYPFCMVDFEITVLGEKVPVGVTDNRPAGRYGNTLKIIGPNPFNARTELCVDLQSDSKVALIIYDVRGRVVKMLMEQFLFHGSHIVTWDGNDEDGMEASSGVYFAVLKIGGVRQCVKMVLVK